MSQWNGHAFKGEYKQTIKQKLLNLYISIR